MTIDFNASHNFPSVPPAPMPVRLLRTLLSGVAIATLFCTALTLPAWAQDAVLRAGDPGSRINLRAAPNATARNLGYGLVGDRVTVLERATGSDGMTWFRVRFPRSGAVGWIRGDFVNLSNPAPAPSRAGVLTAADPNSQINLRQSANPGSRSLGYGLVGDRVEVLGESRGTDNYVWYRVRFPVSGSVGWVRGDFVRIMR